MSECKWCEEPVPGGGRFCDELCEKLHQNREAQQTTVGGVEYQKRTGAQHKNQVRSGADDESHNVREG